MPISTIRAGNTLGRPGFFSTNAECQSVLADEVAVFVEQTGLQPLYTPYCFEHDSPYNDMPWMFRIEAFGTAIAQPRLEMGVLFGQIIGYSRDTFFTAVIDGLLDLGLEPRQLRLESSIGLSYLTVFLYAIDRVRFETAEFAKLDTVEGCLAELDRFELATEDTDKIVLYCAAQQPTGRAEVTGMFLDALPFEIVESLDRFASYAACAAGRENVITRYRADGLDVVDGLCHLNQDRQWKVNLLLTLD